MAKDDREILHAIRMPATEEAPRVTYKPGMEDELASAFPQSQLDAWVKAGDLAGAWKHLKAEPKKEK